MKVTVGTNRNAVNMTELANATKIAGSQAAQGGVEVDELTAAIGTMMVATQQGGDIAGRAFRSILMNLQQVSGNCKINARILLAPYVQ